MRIEYEGWFIFNLVTREVDKVLVLKELTGVNLRAGILIKKIPFNCYIRDATAVVILLSEIDCRDRHALPVESEHTATSSIYGEESPHKIELDRTRVVVTKTAYLIKRKNDIITRFREWTELTVENMKSLAEANQVEKSDINKLWESSLTGFGGVIHLNNIARIMEKKLLKSEDYKNMNIFKE